MINKEENQQPHKQGGKKQLLWTKGTATPFSAFLRTLLFVQTAVTYLFSTSMLRGGGGALHTTHNSTKIHHKLWIGDVASLQPPASSECFEFGRPPFALKQIRVQGVVVSVGKADTATVAYTLDDGTGVIRCEIPLSKLQTRTTAPAVGDLVDVVGSLEADSGTCWISVMGLDIKEDPAAEILRALELLGLYRDLYFKQAQENSHCVSQSQSQSQSHPCSQSYGSSPLAIQSLPTSNNSTGVSTPVHHISPMAAHYTVPLAEWLLSIRGQQQGLTFHSICQRYSHLTQHTLEMELQALMERGLCYQKDDGSYYPL